MNIEEIEFIQDKFDKITEKEKIYLKSWDVVDRKSWRIKLGNRRSKHYNPYRFADVLIEKNVGKSYNLTYSYYVKQLRKNDPFREYLIRYFRRHFLEYDWRPINEYYTDDDGNIQKRVDEDVELNKKLHKINNKLRNKAHLDYIEKRKLRIKNKKEQSKITFAERFKASVEWRIKNPIIYYNKFRVSYWGKRDNPCLSFVLKQYIKDNTNDIITRDILGFYENLFKN